MLSLYVIYWHAKYLYLIIIIIQKSYSLSKKFLLYLHTLSLLFYFARVFFAAAVIFACNLVERQKRQAENWRRRANEKIRGKNAFHRFTNIFSFIFISIVIPFFSSLVAFFSSLKEFLTNFKSHLTVYIERARLKMHSTILSFDFFFLCCVFISYLLYSTHFSIHPFLPPHLTRRPCAVFFVVCH